MIHTYHIYLRAKFGHSTLNTSRDISHKLILANLDLENLGHFFTLFYGISNFFNFQMAILQRRNKLRENPLAQW